MKESVELEWSNVDDMLSGAAEAAEQTMFGGDDPELEALALRVGKNNPRVNDFFQTCEDLDVDPTAMWVGLTTAAMWSDSEGGRPMSWSASLLFIAHRILHGPAEPVSDEDDHRVRVAAAKRMLDLLNEGKAV